jgi:hypothetical protein
MTRFNLLSAVALPFAAGVTTLGFSACSLFEIDNFDAPEETITGKIVDIETGEPVLTEQNVRGIRIRLTELSWGENVTYNPDANSSSERRPESITTRLQEVVPEGITSLRSVKLMYLNNILFSIL